MGRPTVTPAKRTIVRVACGARESGRRSCVPRAPTIRGGPAKPPVRTSESTVPSVLRLPAHDAVPSRLVTSKNHDSSEACSGWIR